MSEVIEVGTWHGIPIRNVRGGYFIDALRTVNTLRKLTVNQETIEFANQNDGRVVIDGTYLNWRFICPLGAFSPADFEGKNVRQFLDVVAHYTSSRYVKAWEDFISFVNTKSEILSSVMGQVTAGSATAPGLAEAIQFDSIPTFSPMPSFSDFIRWVQSVLPSALLVQPASVMMPPNETGVYGCGLNMVTSIQNMEYASMSFTFEM